MHDYRRYTVPVTAEPHKAREQGTKTFYAEIIYENGDHSVGAYTDMDALVTALADHHDRAKSAKPIHSSWGPTEKPVIATRVVAVHIYDQHPGNVDVNTITEDDASKRLKEAFTKKDGYSAGEMNVYDLHMALTPQVLVEGGPHDSNYEMKPVKTLDPALWQG